MAFTRFHDDEARIIRRLQQQTDIERWHLDVPGNGENPSFMLDPHIISQKWGGNLWTNKTDIHSSLLGIDRIFTKDCLVEKRQSVYTAPIDYPLSDKLTTEQSRAIMPAWTARDLEQNHGYILLKNPQANTEIPFNHCVSTRIVEKDNFKREMPNIPENSQLYTLPPLVYESYRKN
jgi:hypothetical protein